MSEDALAREDNPSLPRGGRAALGTAAGLSMATMAAAAWARLQRDTWQVEDVSDHGVRIGIAFASLVGATIGAALVSPPATRRGAVVGSAFGVIAAHAPLVWDPFLVKRHPVLGNLWQYGIPIAGAVLGANAVSP